MATTNYGIEKIGSWFTGESVTPTNYCEFGTGSSSFNSGSYYLEAGFTRKAISWSWLDGDPRATVTLATTEANGSNIQEFGFGVGAGTGSNIYFRELSAIGTKNSSFDVEISAKLRIRRSI